MKWLRHAHVHVSKEAYHMAKEAYDMAKEAYHTAKEAYRGRKPVRRGAILVRDVVIPVVQRRPFLYVFFYFSICGSISWYGMSVIPFM